MKKYEFKTLRVQWTALGLEGEVALRFDSTDGWEIKGVIPSHNGGSALVLLQREIAA